MIISVKMASVFSLGQSFSEGDDVSAALERYQ